MVTIRDLRIRPCKARPWSNRKQGLGGYSYHWDLQRGHCWFKSRSSVLFFRKLDYFKMPCSFLQKSNHPSFLYVLGKSFILESLITMLHSHVDVRSLVILPVTLFELWKSVHIRHSSFYPESFVQSMNNESSLILFLKFWILVDQ